MFLDMKSLSALAGAPFFLPCRYGVRTKSAQRLTEISFQRTLAFLEWIFRTL